MSVEKTVQELRDEVRSAMDAAEAVSDKWDTEGRNPRPDERAKHDRLIRKVDNLSYKLALAESEETERRLHIQQARKRTLGPSNSSSSTSAGSVRISNEPLTYEADAPHSFFRDLVRAERGTDMEARERLARHQKEATIERRDLSSTDGVGGELVPPIWLLDEYVALARAGRPFADSVNQRPLPQGTDSVNLPKVLTGSATAAQADLGAVQETDPTTGSVSIPVKTIAGQVDVSRQLLDRGAFTDEVIFGDLIADYNQRLDLQTLIGSGSGANMKGVRSDANRIAITYTDASPTVGELYSKIQDASQQIATLRFLPATHVAMHPRRWAWIAAASDTTGRPLVVPNASATNSPASVSYNAAEGPVATLAGLQVVLDANLPTNLGAGTNEDSVIVYRANDLWLMEDSPVKTRLDESSPAGTTTPCRYGC
jgi:HK97 family phage major capsid protein